MRYRVRRKAVSGIQSAAEIHLSVRDGTTARAHHRRGLGVVEAVRQRDRLT